MNSISNVAITKGRVLREHYTFRNLREFGPSQIASPSTPIAVPTLLIAPFSVNSFGRHATVTFTQHIRVSDETHVPHGGARCVMNCVSLACETPHAKQSAFREIRIPSVCAAINLNKKSPSIDEITAESGERFRQSYRREYESRYSEVNFVLKKE